MMQVKKTGNKYDISIDYAIHSLWHDGDESCYFGLILLCTCRNKVIEKCVVETVPVCREVGYPLFIKLFTDFEQMNNPELNVFDRFSLFASEMINRCIVYDITVKRI